MSQQLTRFTYPDAEIRSYCEVRITTIRQADRAIMHGLYTKGEALSEVKDRLPHGQFGYWLSDEFGMSSSTAANYMNLYNACEQNPKFWEFDPSILYLLTSQTPEVARTTLLESGPCSLNDARALLWQAEIEQHIAVDDPETLGDVLYAVQQAKEDSALKRVALAVLEKYEEVFAKLSSRDIEEIRYEVGGSTRQRYDEPRPAKALYSLVEGAGNCTLGAYLGEIFYPLAQFAKQENNPQLEALRRHALGMIAEVLDIRDKEAI